MSWFKVDDKLWGHPKWLATPIRARGLWVTAGSWSADQEMDGNIPRHVLPILGATLRDASALVAAGLWQATDTGWRFHGWAEFQPTREQKEAEREAARERMRAGRERKAAKRAEDVRPNNDEVRESFGRSSEDVRSTPSRPDPTRPVTTPDGVVRPARATKLPTDWEPTSEHRARAAEDSLDVGREATKFRAHADEKGRTAKNWNAAFTRWLINAAEYAQRDTARGTRSTDRQGDLLKDEMARARAADARAGQLQIDGAA